MASDPATPAPHFGKLCFVGCVGAALLAGASSCGAGDSEDEGTPGAGGDGTGGSTIVTGGTGGTDGDGGTGNADNVWIERDPPAGPHWEHVACGASPLAYKDPSLDDGVCNQFGGGAAASGVPVIVYPLSGSMHARNISQITFQWLQGDPSNTLFRIEIDSVATGDRYHLYVPCTLVNCVVEFPRNEWLDLAWWNNTGEPVTIRVQGTNGAGGPVATSADITVHFSPSDVIGALYYWAAAKGEIKRATMGADQAVPFIVPNSPTNDFACSSCHSVSRNGSTIAFAVCPPSGEDVAAIRVAPTDNPTQPYVRPSGAPGNPTDFLGHNVALSPDGTLAAINGVAESGWPPYLEIRDAQSGATLGKYDLQYSEVPPFGGNNLGIHPEWSPDGTRIAVTLAHADLDTTEWGCVWTSETCRSSIAVMGYLGNGELGAPRVVVEQSGMDYHFYPTWSPDGEWIAFVSATLDEVGSSIKSENTPGTVLRMVRSTGGPHPCPGPDCIELTNGTQYTWENAQAGNGRHSTWPKFTPFAQGETNNIFFIGFSTKNDYGFLSSGVDQIWMFAVDTNLVGSGDPSYAPVWLPYQEFDDSSLTPYWTQVLPCEADPSGACSGCVEGEECEVNAAANVCRCVGTYIQ